MLFRALLLLPLLAVSASRVQAAPSAAIADLNLARPTGDSLLEVIRRDLSVAGYTLNEQASILRGLNGRIQDSDLKDAANELLQSAQHQYEEFNLDNALRTLHSFDALSLEARHKSDAALLARRHLLEGLIRFAQNRSAKAISSFRITHRLVPSLQQLDAAEHRPTVVQLYKAAVTKNNESASSRLQANWKPSKASLFVDGSAWTDGLPIDQGPHDLLLLAEGYAPQAFLMHAGQKNTITKTLRPLSQTEHLRVLRKQAAFSQSQSPKRFHALAMVAGVETLVLVHSGPEGPRAALYRVSDHTLSDWVLVGSVRWQSLLGLQSISTSPAAMVATQPQAQPIAPWYQQWWGGSLLVGGTAIVGTALYFALSLSSASEDRATIDQWCFGSCQ